MTGVENNTEYQSFRALPSVAPVTPAAPVTSPYGPPWTASGSNAQPSSSPAPMATAPSAAQSPTDQSSSSAPATTASPNTDALLAQLLGGLSTGQNTGAANSGSGVGAADTSLPSPTAADVAALQPTAASTSSSGPNILLILGIVAVIGFGVWYYLKHRKESE